MAEFRNIHTRIWKDDWFSELEVDAKCLFIYLFSNERASVCGMYELPLKYIAFETGIDKKRVVEILGEFEQAKKVYYRDSLVWVVNLKKYNDSGDNAKVRIRTAKDLETIPDCELKKMYFEYHKIPYPHLQIPYPEKKSETDTETDTLAAPDGAKEQTQTDPTDGMPWPEELSPDAPGVVAEESGEDIFDFAAPAEPERQAEPQAQTEAAVMVDALYGMGREVKNAGAFAALQAGLARASKPCLDWCAADVLEWAEAFAEQSKLPTPKSKSERAFWVQSLREMREVGVSPALVRDAVTRMRKDHMTIKSPASVKAVAVNLMASAGAQETNKRKNHGTNLLNY